MTARLRPPVRYAILLALLVCGRAVAAEEMALIVSADAPALHVDQAAVRDIYLKKIVIDDDGRTLVPVNLPPDHPLRAALSETLFRKSAQQLQDYWNQRYFQGITPPYVLNSQAAVLQFVAKTPGAIGYVAACRLDERVRPVLRLAVPPAQQAAVAKLCADD